MNLSIYLRTHWDLEPKERSAELPFGAIGTNRSGRSLPQPESGAPLDERDFPARHYFGKPVSERVLPMALPSAYWALLYSAIAVR